MGRLFLGTSGFSYDEWVGAFYPPGTSSQGRLAFYAERFNSVEINSTFYRFPTADMLGRWRGETPSGFSFSFKAGSKITHRLRLAGAEREAADFFDRLSLLGDRLGAVLFQLPPYLKRDDRLAAFLAALGPSGPRLAFEFRHASWYDESTYEALAAAGAALCLADGTGMPAGTEVKAVARDLTGSAGFAYLRLRGQDYSPADLGTWADFVAGLLGSADVCAYFKHEEEARGIDYAVEFGRLVGGGPY
ncbi:MAG TPA: DUF72 domain-containing protein [Bacillota bacterium]|jgi:uncharacterized protein YecE (DUF72 family)